MVLGWAHEYTHNQEIEKGLPSKINELKKLVGESTMKWMICFESMKMWGWEATDCGVGLWQRHFHQDVLFL